MKAYFAYFRMRFLTLLRYRVVAIAGICTQWAFGMVHTMILCAFYASSDAVQPMSLAQAVTYVWVGQAMLGALPWNTEPEIANSVRTGQVAYELSRPHDIYLMWYARSLAQRTAPTLLRAVPQFLIALFLIPEPYGMQMPTLAAFASWLAAAAGSVFLSAAITNFMHSTLFWTVSGEGFSRFLPTFVTLFSGMIVPLELMPGGMELFMKYQPFAGVMDLPLRLFCGTLDARFLWQVLLIQAFWTAAFMTFGRLLMRRGLGRLTVAGG